MEDKLRDTIYYLVQKLSKLQKQYRSKKKLAKLLYLVDFYYFKEHGKAIATEEYKALPMGPVPKDFYATLGLMEVDGFIKMEKVTLVNKNTGKKYDYDIYVPTGEMDVSLNAEELSHIDKIFDKFKHTTALQLEQLSHSQAPWNSVDEKEIIPIETAYLLPAFDELQV